MGSGVRDLGSKFPPVIVSCKTLTKSDSEFHLWSRANKTSISNWRVPLWEQDEKVWMKAIYKFYNIMQNGGGIM